MLMAWGEGQTLGARFDEAAELGRLWHPHWKLGASYGGFTAALGRWLNELVPAVVRRFQRIMRALAGSHWTRCGWCALAADGSRIETPHTTANEAGLGCAGARGLRLRGLRPVAPRGQHRSRVRRER